MNMNKHLSVLALWARHSLWKVVALLAAMGVLETAVVLLRWNMRQPDLPPPAMDELWQGRVGPVLVCQSALLLLALLLTFSCGDQKGGVGYTLRRLRIQEETAVLWRTVYNGVCFLLFWAVQAAVAVGICCWYASAIGPDYSSRQTVFLAMYRIPFFHNILPLSHWVRYLSLICLLAAASLSSAMMSYEIRRGSRFGWGMMLFLLCMINQYLKQEINQWIFDAFFIAVSGAALITEGSYLWREQRGEYHEV